MRTLILSTLMAASLLLARQAVSADLPRVAYVALNIADEKRAMDFYVGLIGMELRTRITPVPNLTETLLGFKDSQAAGVLLVRRGDRAKPYEVGDGFSRTIIDVNKIDALMKKLTDSGVKVVRPVTAMPSLKLKYAMVKDPDGYTVEFVQSD